MASDSDLGSLLDRGMSPNSDALVVVRAGELLCDWRSAGPRRPISTMSVTKTIGGLAVGVMLEAGLLQSLDQTISDVLGVWQEDPRSSITIRHVLGHCSGLAPSPSTQEIYSAPDSVEHALAAPLVHPPGEVFAYDNRAINLISRIAWVLSGVSLDELLEDKLFGPLGIAEYEWSSDRAGNPYVMAGLALFSCDLALLGQVVLADGVWCGRRLVSREWLRASCQFSEHFSRDVGLGWWLVAESVQVGVDELLLAEWCGASPPVPDRVLRPLQALVGARYEPSRYLEVLGEMLGSKDLELFHDSTWRRGLRDARKWRSGLSCFYSAGELGQYLVVVPRARVVVVRQRIRRGPWDCDNLFPDFVLRVCDEYAVSRGS